MTKRTILLVAVLTATFGQSAAIANEKIRYKYDALGRLELTKRWEHGSSAPWGQTNGNPAQWTQQGMALFRVILREEGRFRFTRGDNGAGFWENRLPNDQGIRLNQDLTFN